MDDIRQQKRLIRDRMKALRDSLGSEDVLRAAEAAASRIPALAVYPSSAIVCVYASVGKEVPTYHLMERMLADGKKVVVPDWEGWKQGEGLRVVSIASTLDLLKDGRIVPQPKVIEGRILPVQDVELFLVPGTAFDPSGNRIGMGGGYFDRLLSLASPKATLIGLAYNFQVMSRIPVSGHDIPVHEVITLPLSG